MERPNPFPHHTNYPFHFRELLERLGGVGEAAGILAGHGRAGAETSERFGRTTAAFGVVRLRVFRTNLNNSES